MPAKAKIRKEINGSRTSVQYGQMQKGLGQRTISTSFGKVIEDLDVRGHVFWGQGNGSDQDYTSYYGTTYNLIGNYQLNPSLVEMAMDYKGLSTRFLMDEYKIFQRSQTGASVEQLIVTEFDTYALDASYAWQILPQLTLTPRMLLKY